MSAQKAYFKGLGGPRAEVKKAALKQTMEDVQKDTEKLEVMRVAREKGRISRQRKPTA